MKIYDKTGVNCYICGKELKLVSDGYVTEIDGELYDDVDYYFECPNECDGEYETMDDYDNIIFKILLREDGLIFGDEK
jgi:hypothetical protein